MLVVDRQRPSEHPSAPLSEVNYRPADFPAPHEMRFSIEALERLPPLPEVARRLLQLKGDPDCDVGRLADVINLEPAIAAQLLRWANSAAYGVRGKIATVKDAIIRTLGFEGSLDLALGLASLTPLQTPVEGLLGKRFFWRQTLAGSALLQKLAAQLPRQAIRRDELHLIYLLHNAGHLLVAHLYPDEFAYLRLLARGNPELSPTALERHAWNIDHGQIGAWLMNAWHLPDRLAIVCRHHHNPFYRGEEEVLVWLTCLTDRLLGELGIGDAVGTALLDEPLLANLGLTLDQVSECKQSVAEALPQLDEAVAQLI